MDSVLFYNKNILCKKHNASHKLSLDAKFYKKVKNENVCKTK